MVYFRCSAPSLVRHLLIKNDDGAAGLIVALSSKPLCAKAYASGFA